MICSSTVPPLTVMSPPARRPARGASVRARVGGSIRAAAASSTGILSASGAGVVTASKHRALLPSSASSPVGLEHAEHEASGRQASRSRPACGFTPGQVGDPGVERRERGVERELALLVDQHRLRAARARSMLGLAQPALATGQPDAHIVVLEALLALVALAQACVATVDERLRALLGRGGVTLSASTRSRRERPRPPAARGRRRRPEPTNARLPAARSVTRREPNRKRAADATDPLTAGPASGGGGEPARALADQVDDLAHDPVDVEVLRREDGGDPASRSFAASAAGMIPPTTTGTSTPFSAAGAGSRGSARGASRRGSRGRRRRRPPARAEAAICSGVSRIPW